MKGAVIESLGSAPVVAELAEPTPQSGFSIVRMAAACLAHVDRSIATGSFAARPALPYVPGTDGSGWVEQSETLPAGTFVWLRGGGLGVQRDGTCAEYALVPDAALHPAPADIDPLLAACFFSPVTSAYTAVHEVGRLVEGEDVLITGANGAVGSLAVQLALRAAAGAVIGAVRTATSARRVPAGAQVVIGTPPDSSVDLLIDTVGGPELPHRLRAVRPGGRAVLVGYTAGTEVTLDLPNIMLHDVALLPLNMIRRAPQAFAIADGLLRELGAGDLQLALTPHSLSSLETAWAALCAGEVDGRLVIRLS